MNKILPYFYYYIHTVVWVLVSLIFFSASHTKDYNRTRTIVFRHPPLLAPKNTTRYFSFSALNLENINNNKKIDPSSYAAKKLALLRRGFYATFEDMSKMREPYYKAIPSRYTPSVELTLDKLKYLKGVYIITNKITKKVYIGKSNNLHTRFKQYFDTYRLKNNQTSRIHRALLKYDYHNFSIAIIDL